MVEKFTFDDVVRAMEAIEEEANQKENKTMKNVILIHKEAGTKKGAVRVRRESDIPDFLKGAIKVVDSKVQLQCVEGTETANFGEVIGYETSERTPSGYNCWVIGNAATNLVEKNGVFYKKATVMKAALVCDEDGEDLE